MKPSSRAPGTSSGLSDSVHHRLNMYALGASAAGVSLLGLTQPSEAKVVYTKTHQVIGTNGIYNLDFNHDGIVDFLILESGYATFNGTRGSNTLLAKEALGNAVEGTIVGRRQFAAALMRGALISRGKHFIKGGFRGETMVATGDSDLSSWKTGPWLNVTNRYLGLKFKIAGKTHYGWARLSVQLPGNFLIKATLTGYAYETVPNMGIRAGQTTSDSAGGSPKLSHSDTHDSNDSLVNPSDPSQSTSLGVLALGARKVVARRQP
jgi:hypothetical protein